MKGYPDAQHMLGEMLERGHGTQADAVEAKKWYTRAAELHHAPALTKLAEMYESAGGADAVQTAFKLYLEVFTVANRSLMLQRRRDSATSQLKARF